MSAHTVKMIRDDLRELDIPRGTGIETCVGPRPILVFGGVEVVEHFNPGLLGVRGCPSFVARVVKIRGELLLVAVDMCPFSRNSSPSECDREASPNWTVLYSRSAIGFLDTRVLACIRRSTEISQKEVGGGEETKDCLLRIDK